MDNLTFRVVWGSGSSQQNTYDLPMPKHFEMQKTPNIVNELHTMSGNILYDINGWKYADTTIEWGVLYPEMLKRLLNDVIRRAELNNTLYLEFTDAEGNAQSILTVVKNFKSAKTLVKYGNEYVWEGVAVTLSFPECYQSS